MKESDITPEIIAKAKEVAEKWRMEIYRGCWVWFENQVYVVFIDEDRYYKIKVSGRSIPLNAADNNCFPIPSISDVLEKLGELKIQGMEICHVEHLLSKYLMGKITLAELHLALLTALCEVLKESQ